MSSITFFVGASAHGILGHTEQIHSYRPGGRSWDILDILWPSRSASNIASLKNWEKTRERFQLQHKNLLAAPRTWPSENWIYLALFLGTRNIPSTSSKHHIITQRANISVSMKGQPNALAVSCWCLCFAERSTRDLPARDVQSWH